MRSISLLALALLSVALAACAHDPERSFVSSTEGSTLVRTGEVTAVNETQVTVRLQEGELKTYQVEPDATFRVGDRVKLVSHKGVVGVTH